MDCCGQMVSRRNWLWSALVTSASRVSGCAAQRGTGSAATALEAIPTTAQLVLRDYISVDGADRAARETGTSVSLPVFIACRSGSSRTSSSQSTVSQEKSGGVTVRARADFFFGCAIASP